MWAWGTTRIWPTTSSPSSDRSRSGGRRQRRGSACSTSRRAGNASLPAAATGAEVVASDLTPELLTAGRREAEKQGLSIDWVEADVEALPFPDADFDAVLSVVGAMFAPHHQQTADEILRVCRPAAPWR